MCGKVCIVEVIFVRSVFRIYTMLFTTQHEFAEMSMQLG